MPVLTGAIVNTRCHFTGPVVDVLKRAADRLQSTRGGTAHAFVSASGGSGYAVVRAAGRIADLVIDAFRSPGTRALAHPDLLVVPHLAIPPIFEFTRLVARQVSAAAAARIACRIPVLTRITLINQQTCTQPDQKQ